MVPQDRTHLPQIIMLRVELGKHLRQAGDSRAVLAYSEYTNKRRVRHQAHMVINAMKQNSPCLHARAHGSASPASACYPRVFNSLHLKRILGLFRRISQFFCGPVLHPFDRSRIHWDGLVLVALMYCLLEIPFRVCFDAEVSPLSFGGIFNLFVDIFFLFDCYIHFRTGYHDNGEFIHDRKNIALNYMKGWFFIDFVTSVPVPWVVAVSYDVTGIDSSTDVLRLPRLLRILKVLRLIKLLRLFKLMKMMSQWEQHENAPGKAALVRVIRFVLLISVVSHISGCVWMGTAIWTMKVDGTYHADSWIVRTNTQDETIPRLYLLSLCTYRCHLPNCSYVMLCCRLGVN